MDLSRRRTAGKLNEIDSQVELIPQTWISVLCRMQARKSYRELCIENAEGKRNNPGGYFDLIGEKDSKMTLDLLLMTYVFLIVCKR